MRRLDIGDKAVVLSEKKLRNRYHADKEGNLIITDDLEFTKDMFKFCGQYVTIARHIKCDGFLYNGYEIEEDKGEFFWSNLFFERI